MNKQEVFDKVVARLRDGSGQALHIKNGEVSGCAYFDPATRKKCAVGLFIDENSEMAKFEYGVYDLVDFYEDDVPAVIRNNLELMEELQLVHDAPNNWTGNQFNGNGEGMLASIASIYRLEYRSV